MRALPRLFGREKAIGINAFGTFHVAEVIVDVGLMSSSVVIFAMTVPHEVQVVIRRLIPSMRVELLINVVFHLS